MHVCIYIYLVFMCAGVGVQRSTHMEVRGQLAGVGFLLPPSGSLLTKVISLGSMYFYPLGHLVSPIFDYFLVQNYWLFQGKVLRQFVSTRQEALLFL